MSNSLSPYGAKHLLREIICVSGGLHKGKNIDLFLFSSFLFCYLRFFVLLRDFFYFILFLDLKKAMNFFYRKLNECIKNV